ncbi:hypothetical protein ATCC90586_011295 [Pythium insidiosum]|nr:hypothetical protein ATCC90586_011295 [Pythium insidiosum]
MGRREGSVGPETQYEHNALCACRKLGQRLEQPKKTGAARRRFRRHRNNNNKQSSDENLLTARLLSAETTTHATSSTTTVMMQDFDGFDGVHDHHDLVELMPPGAHDLDDGSAAARMA